MHEPSIYIVIPAYQEETVIYNLIQDTQKAGFLNIIVIDDGSKDKTTDEATRAGAVVFRHHLNRGKGAALRTGMLAAKAHKAEVIVTMDGDGQHSPNDIVEIIKPIMSNSADVVLGVRPRRPIGMTRQRWLATRLGNGLTWMVSGLWVQDSQSGFRAYSIKALDTLKTRSSTYDYESEIIHLIAQHSLKFAEVPISVSYSKYSLNKPQRQNILNGAKTASRLLWRVLS